MPNSYIGINNVARKITGGYIGVNNVARKITKAYVGDSNGVAMLIYDAGGSPGGTPFSFNSNIVPTSWTQVTQYTNYTASNTYGTWTITANPSSRVASNAFDDNVSTQWRPTNLSSGQYGYIQLDFPVLLKPSQIIIVTMRSKNNAKVQLQDTSNVWNDVYSLTGESSKKEETINLSLNAYYKALRIYGIQYNSSYPYFQMYKCQISSGTGLQ